MRIFLHNLVLVLILICAVDTRAADDTYLMAALDVVSVPSGNELDVLAAVLTDVQLNAFPHRAPLRKGYEQFFKEVLQSDEVNVGLAEVYMEYFSYEELIELKKLMSSSIYQKLNRSMPHILKKNMEKTRSLIPEYQPRLDEILRAEHYRVQRKAQSIKIPSAE